MPENRLPSKAYKMLYALHSKNKNNSTTENKNNACALHCTDTGLDLFGENQGVCNVNNFICGFT